MNLNSGTNHCSAGRARNTRIRFSVHARDRMHQIGIQDSAVRAALGKRIVDASGAFTCRVAAAEDGRLLERPRTGAPLRIGIGVTARDHCRRRAVRTVLLAVLPCGRRLHVVCVPYARARLEVVTLWDPDAPENKGMWAPHAQLPTQHGARSLPPCRWFLADPFDPRRPVFRESITR